MIAWTDFSWEAFATLTTGALAVGAAVAVGFRQVAIQRRQVDIQDAAHRWALFERRYKVFERAQQFIREILQTADDPSPEAQREFLLAKGESRFLFRRAVQDGMSEIWKNWSEFHALKKIMEASYRQHGHYGDGNPEKERVALTWFSNRLSSLADLFEELQLGERRSKPE